MGLLAERAVLLHRAVRAVDRPVRCRAYPVDARSDQPVGRKLTAAGHGGNLHALGPGGVHLRQPLWVLPCQRVHGLSRRPPGQVQQAGGVTGLDPVLVGNRDTLLEPLLRTLAQDVHTVSGQGLKYLLQGALRRRSSRGLGPAPGQLFQERTAAQRQQIQSRVCRLSDSGQHGLVARRRPGLILRHACVQQQFEGHAPGHIVAIFGAPRRIPDLGALYRPGGGPDAGDGGPQNGPRSAHPRRALQPRDDLSFALGQIPGQVLAAPRERGVSVQRVSVALDILRPDLTDGLRVGPVLGGGVVQIAAPRQPLVLPHLPNIIACPELSEEGVVLPGVLVLLHVAHPFQPGAHPLHLPFQLRHFLFVARSIRVHHAAGTPIHVVGSAQCAPVTGEGGPLVQQLGFFCLQGVPRTRTRGPALRPGGQQHAAALCLGGEGDGGVVPVQRFHPQLVRVAQRAPGREERVHRLAGDGQGPRLEPLPCRLGDGGIHPRGGLDGPFLRLKALRGGLHSDFPQSPHTLSPPVCHPARIHSRCSALRAVTLRSLRRGRLLVPPRKTPCTPRNCFFVCGPHCLPAPASPRFS